MPFNKKKYKITKNVKSNKKIMNNKNMVHIVINATGNKKLIKMGVEGCFTRIFCEILNKVKKPKTHISGNRLKCSMLALSECLRDLSRLPILQLKGRGYV